jgi:putative glutamine amidotransferase
MKPIIGINCDYEEKGKRPYSFLYRDYSEAVITAGGIPVLLPIIREKEDAELCVQKIDGLLLSGGDDIPPQRYGEGKKEKTVCIHPDKDISDFAILQAAMQKKKPVLAICYGTQLINVALGGSLIQDIPSECTSAIVHKDVHNKRYTHPVTIQKDSLLYKIVGTGVVEANSTHHQAIKNLGKGILATAHTADGIIEAIECREYPFLIGVQWHPECMIDHASHAALFRLLIKASA